LLDVQSVGLVTAVFVVPQIGIWLGNGITAKLEVMHE
jgi:hypothetical protein